MGWGAPKRDCFLGIKLNICLTWLSCVEKVEEIMEESSAEMESRQKKAGLQNTDVLDQINSLQAYLEKMKERVINGEISNTDTKTALQNLNVNLKVITVTFRYEYLFGEKAEVKYPL